ncbi:MAG: class SAM-dependent methyltransferase [Solirubrobacterales bacterium]|nr:class SAM-dependent methyltransferase [Solirubrobacterales bacterium]
MRTTTRSQDQVNRDGWARPKLVADYAHRRLVPVESAVLSRYRQQLSGRVLELGCGAGRVTGYLIDIAEVVHGIDVLPEMVRYCRRTYPGGTFSVGDLRDLSSFRRHSFDAVVAADNVIDVLDDDGRHDVLDQVRGVLATDGLFVMSSHNLAAAPLIRRPTQVGSPSRRELATNILHLPLRVYNHRRLRSLEHHEPDHAILNDIAHDYSLLHYYIERDTQERQFLEHDFVLIDCLDPDGRTVPRGEHAETCHWLHYVCTPSPSGP